MSDDETFTICPGCGKRIEPPEAQIYAVELKRLDAFTSTEYVEGMGGFFHDEFCFGRTSRWRQKPMPETR